MTGSAADPGRPERLPSDMQKPGKGDVPWLKEILLPAAAGMGLRLLYFADLGKQPFFGHPIVDSLTYHRMAQVFLAGEWSGAFSRPPLYPFFLAILYGFAGVGQGAVAAGQALLGLSAVVPVYLLAARWYGTWAARCAAFLTAVYPLRIFFEGEILAVTLFAALLCWGLWLFWTGLEGNSARRLCGAGVLLGAAVLARPNLLLALPFVAGGSVLAVRRRLRERALPLLVCLACLILTVLPVSLYNRSAEGRLIPVAANGGINFYLGNSPGATGETPLPPGLRWQDTVQEPLRLGIYTLSGQDRYWWGRSLEAVSGDPSGWAFLLLRKGLLFWNAYESSNNKNLDYFTDVSPVVRHYRGWFGALVCLASAGLLVAPRSPGAIPLVSLLAGYGASVTVFFVTARYRLPLVPFLAILAGGGIAATWAAAARGEWRRVTAAAAGAAIAALVVFPSWGIAGGSRIDPDFQMGQVYLGRGEPLAAEAHLLRALSRTGGDPDTFNSLGAVRFALGDWEGAEGRYRRALAYGEFSEVYFNLGVVLERMGRPEDAETAYRRSLEINPLEGRAAANLSFLGSPGPVLRPSGR